MTKGYVYILSNPAMPGLHKIGKTTRSSQARAHELYQTGVPAPFKVEYEVFSPDCSWLERAVHEELSDSREDFSREFFRVDRDEARYVLDRLHVEQVSDLIAEFLPEHVPVLPEMVVDAASVYLLAHELRIHPFEAVSAMGHMVADDLAPGLERYNEWRDKRVAAMRGGAK